MSTESTPSGSGKFTLTEDLYLPAELRDELSMQYSALIEQSELPDLARRYPIVAVGDMVCHTFISSGIVPKIVVFDMKTMRGDIPAEWVEEFMSVPGAQLKVRSPPAVLTKELWDALVMAWRFPGTSKIQVVGEEDLAGLASIYLMKGAIVVYGLPGKGMTGIVSAQKSIETALSILKRMKPVGSRTGQ